MQHADSLWWVILLCGAGTFLLRLLPMRWMQRSQQGGQTPPPRLMGALQALGPAAIGALLVAALWPHWSWGEPLWQVARLLLAISAMLLARGQFGLMLAVFVVTGAAGLLGILCHDKLIKLLSEKKQQMRQHRDEKKEKE